MFRAEYPVITCTLAGKECIVGFVSGKAPREMEPAAKMYERIVSISNTAVKGESIPEQQISITPFELLEIFE